MKARLDVDKKPWESDDEDEEPDYEWDDSDMAADVNLFFEIAKNRAQIEDLLLSIKPRDLTRYLPKWEPATRKRKRW